MDKIASEVHKAGISSAELAEYFASISDSFETTWESKQKHDYFDDLLGVPMWFITFSVVPLIPAVARSVVRSKFSGWRPIILSWHIPVQSLWSWWIGCILISLPFAILALSIDSSRTKRIARDRLKAAPMRFALCLAIVQELDRYAKNGLSKHIEDARSYWKQLHRMLRLLLDPFGRAPMRASSLYIAYPQLDLDFRSGLDTQLTPDFQNPLQAMFPQVRVLQHRFPWFKLSPETSKIVDAFSSLSSKISTRLADRKDLPILGNAFSELATFLYTLIPEVSSTQRHPDSELETIGSESLVRFADVLGTLSIYNSEPQRLEGKEKVRSKLSICLAWLFGLFAHESPIVKFFSWWLLAEIIVLGSLLTAKRYFPDLKLDSTILSLIVGTPLVVSAAALAGPFRKQ